MNKLVDPSTMAELLSIKPRTLLAKASRGEIPSVRVGYRTVRFDPDRVMKALQGSS